MVFLKLRQEAGVPSRVTMGWPFKTRVCSAISQLQSRFQGHLWILLESWQGSRDASRVEEGDPGSLSRVPFQLPLGYWYSYQFSRGVRNRLLLKHATPHSSGDIKGCEASYVYEAGNEGSF